MINARITFSNIQALDSPVQGVTNIQEESGRFSVAIDDGVFAVPRSYDMLGGASENTMRLYGQVRLLIGRYSQMQAFHWSIIYNVAAF